MNVIQLAIALAEKFSPMPSGEVAKLRHELETDWNSVITDETHKGYKPGLKTTIKKYTDGAWARLFIALLFIPSVKWIQEWMMPNDEDKKNVLED